MTTLSRRALLQLAGLAALPSLARAEGAPEGWEDAVHSLAARQAPRFLTAGERATVSAIADAIVPRTDTPGALDVGVTAWVDFLAAEWMNDRERAELRDGLAAMELHAVAAYGLGWPALDAVQRLGELDWASSPLDADTPAKRGYRRLRGHVLHGYLTSERVRREVLKVNITPGRYRGDVPVGAPAAMREEEAGHAH